MGRLKSRLKALLADDSAKTTLSTVEVKPTLTTDTVAAVGNVDSKLKARLTASLADDSVETNTLTPTTRRAVDTPDNKIAVSDSAVKVPNDLPLYTATTAQINRWHSWGNNVFLQTLLRGYDANYSSASVYWYNRLKIGYDNETHAATFAVDQTHYYRIQFDEKDARPVSYNNFKPVLFKLDQIRDEHNDEYLNWLKEIWRRSCSTVSFDDFCRLQRR